MVFFFTSVCMVDYFDKFSYGFFFGFFETGFLCGLGACPGTSSCRPGWSQTHKDLPVSASQVLGLKACATTARLRVSYVEPPLHLWNEGYLITVDDFLRVLGLILPVIF